MERKSGRVVVLVLAGHALAAAWTWRDIRQQPAQQVRERNLLADLQRGQHSRLGRLLADRPPLPEISAEVGAESKGSGGHVADLLSPRRISSSARQSTNAYQRKQA